MLGNGSKNQLIINRKIFRNKKNKNISKKCNNVEIGMIF